MRNREFLEAIVKHFDLEEIKTLCFYIENVDYENLPGEGKTVKARELIRLCERMEIVPELIEALAHMRPKVDWETLCGPFSKTNNSITFKIEATISDEKFTISKLLQLEKAFASVLEIPIEDVKYVGYRMGSLIFEFLLPQRNLEQFLRAQSLLKRILNAEIEIPNILQLLKPEKKELLRTLGKSRYQYARFLSDHRYLNGEGIRENILELSKRITFEQQKDLEDAFNKEKEKFLFKLFLVEYEFEGKWNKENVSIEEKIAAWKLSKELIKQYIKEFKHIEDRYFGSPKEVKSDSQDIKMAIALISILIAFAITIIITIIKVFIPDSETTDDLIVVAALLAFITLFMLMTSAPAKKKGNLENYLDYTESKIEEEIDSDL